MIVQVSVQMPAFTSFGCIPRSGIVGSHGNAMISFLRNHYNVLFSSWGRTIFKHCFNKGRKMIIFHDFYPKLIEIYLLKIYLLFIYEKTNKFIFGNLKGSYTSPFCTPPCIYPSLTHDPKALLLRKVESMFPSLELEFAHVTCFGQWDTNKFHISRGFKGAYTTGFALALTFIIRICPS